MEFLVQCDFIIIMVLLADVIISQTIGTDKTKKLAKQAAAKNYLQCLFNQTPKSDDKNGVCDSTRPATPDTTEPSIDNAKNLLG